MDPDLHRLDDAIRARVAATAQHPAEEIVLDWVTIARTVRVVDGHNVYEHYQHVPHGQDPALTYAALQSAFWRTSAIQAGFLGQYRAP